MGQLSNLVKFKRSLTKRQFNELILKDADTLYFPSDGNSIMLGDKVVGEANTVTSVAGKTGAVSLESLQLRLTPKEVFGGTPQSRRGGLLFNGENSGIIRLDASFFELTEADASGECVVSLRTEPNAEFTDCLATQGYVDDLVTEKMGTADAMVFSGTLGTNGTITALPTANVTKGQTYKVITAGTYAGNVCKIGDMLIALNTKASNVVAADWAYIPSGNENETSLRVTSAAANVNVDFTAQMGALTLGDASLRVMASTYYTAPDTSIMDAKTVKDYVSTRIIASSDSPFAAAAPSDANAPTVKAVKDFIGAKSISIAGNSVALDGTLSKQTLQSSLDVDALISAMTWV